MYQQFFGFKEAPFSIAPDPRYLYMSERHREALAHLVYGIRSEGGFVLLTGEVGTGKTTVCRCLLEQVPEKTEIALVLNPKLTTVELLATLCDELRIPCPEGNGSIKVFVDRINARLLENFASGCRTVLIIDEAQNLEAEVLEQIRLLTNLETNDRKLLQIIMLGQPELRAKLARPELRQLAQRITARYHLEPLSRKEAVSYIHHRLQVSGVGRPVFTSRAVGRIYRLSGGIPRRINVLADRALLGAYVRGREKADGRIVARAAREAFDCPSVSPLWRWGAFTLLPVAALLFLAFNYLDAPPSIPIVSAPVSQAPSISADATKASLEWPIAPSDAGSRRLAFDALFKIWNLKPGAGDPCVEAESLGFSCLERQDGFENLRRFNLPAILPLTSPEGKTFHAALVGLRDDVATFSFATSTAAVPVEALQDRWGGKYILLWRKPPFAGDLRQGSRGEAVRWLSERLAKALRLPPLPPSGGGDPVLEGELLAQLKRFQFNAGLAPDGVVGPYTLIFLDAAVGDGVPLLDERPEVR